MVLEGDVLNLVVTSPAATLALALMFLKTNDAAVAGYFFIPDSAYALDLVRPDQVRNLGSQTQYLSTHTHHFSTLNASRWDYLCTMHDAELSCDMSICVFITCRCCCACLAARL